MNYQNPIIKGFNPDPSICRVGEDFYLVTSTFEFFPGVPIYHSKNLVNWELINHCLSSESQLNLKDCRCSGGIYAPTIRYYDGIFYMVTTNITDKGNFFVYTDDIYGKWSEPIWVDQGGIDPSLLFDDGKVYFTSTGSDANGKACICICEINPQTGEKLTPTTLLNYGCGGRFCEAPHLYKIGKYYYLMIAEGGTEFGHMVTMQRSSSPYGPFEPCPYNPILSHRNYGNSPIQATGHADIVEDEKSNWWLVCLGIRPLKQAMLHNLGRETFLAPIHWDNNGWPIVGEGGTIELAMNGPLPGTPEPVCFDFKDNFQTQSLNLEWNYVRNPDLSLYQTGNGLSLTASSETLNDNQPTFIGIRQKEFHMEAETEITLSKGIGLGGITAFYTRFYHYDLFLETDDNSSYLVLRSTVHGFTAEVKRISLPYTRTVKLKIMTGPEKYSFYYEHENIWIDIGHAATAGLCTEANMHMTFTGTYIGLFAEEKTSHYSYFSLKEIKSN
ncbi:glycoside hydrolase family 43 protein [Scatolibacter rhodanostii]|uniref:glycoside hydrolase family 43 protein n=1 Tax=Scatolibacter rhodanostii TaxID=2014781 RepID=UPI000C07D412|nr:glycoside hydrolase family 43 protein [Scatolibacter rhodanostii]